MILRGLKLQGQTRQPFQVMQLCNQPGIVSNNARLVVHVLAGFDNGAVTGTTTQISRQRVIDIGACWSKIIMVKRKHRHNETRRTETTL